MGFAIAATLLAAQCELGIRQDEVDVQLLPKTVAALENPSALGARLSDALRDRRKIAFEQTLTYYCPKPRRAPVFAAHDAGCSKARVRIHRSGKIDYRDDAHLNPGSWCILGDGTPPARIIAALRANTAFEEDGYCFDAEVNTVYGPHDGPPGSFGVLRLWSGLPNAADLELAQTDAKKRVEALLGAAAASVLQTKWATLLSLAPADKKPAPADVRKIVCLPLGALCAHEPFKAILDSLEKTEWKYSCAELEAKVTAKPVKAAALFEATRALALAHQPAEAVVLPSPWYAGDIPSAREPQIVALASGSGSIRLDPGFTASTELAVFAHDLSRKDVASLSRGKNKIVAEPSPLAILSAVLIRSAMAATGVSASAGADQFEAEKPCDPAGDPKTLDECLLEKLRAIAPKAAEAVELKPTGDFDDAVRRLGALKLQLENPAVTALEGGAMGPFLEKYYRRIAAHDDFLGAVLPNATGTISSPFTSRIVPGDALEAGYPYEARICRDSTDCTIDTDKTKVTARRRFIVEEAHAIVSTATELAGVISTSDRPLGGYEFQRIGGVSGPQEFHQLRAVDGVADYLTISQLIVIYPVAAISDRRQFAERFAFAFGPTLFRSDQPEFFKQWNFRLGIELVDRLMFTAGYAFRFVDEPAGRFRAGDTVALDIGAEPPRFQTESTLIHLLGVGIAVDLGVLGDAASAMQKVFAGEEGER